MTQQTAEVTGFARDFVSDPAVVAELVDLAHNFVALCCGVGYWSKLPRAQQVSNTASAIQDYVRARSFADPLDVARVLVDDGHMDPPCTPVLVPEPEEPAVVAPERTESVNTPVAGNAGLVYRPGWTKSPWAQLEKRETQFALGTKGDACVEPWHPLLLAILSDKTPNESNGGPAYIPTTALAALLLSLIHI